MMTIFNYVYHISMYCVYIKLQYIIISDLRPWDLAWFICIYTYMLRQHRQHAPGRPELPPVQPADGQPQPLQPGLLQVASPDTGEAMEKHHEIRIGTAATNISLGTP